MRKLTDAEFIAQEVLRRHGSYCPGSSDGYEAYDKATFLAALDGLVKKRRATVEMTDDGPRYHAL